jgi:hypothetical protein
MARSATVKCSFKYSEDEKKGDAYARLTAEEAGRVSAYHIARQKAISTSTPVPDPPADSRLGEVFYRDMRMNTAVPVHTPAHAEKARTNIFAMQYKYGKPSLWYVICSNVDCRLK